MINTRAGTFPGSGHIQDDNTHMENPRGDGMGSRFRCQIDDAVGFMKAPGSVDRQGRAALGGIAGQD